MEQKNTGEFVDDLINQNRHLAEILTEQDKKLCEEHRKETEAEKKKKGSKEAR